MTKMRAKLKVHSVHSFERSESLVFNAVCPPSFDPDGKHEDNTFSKYTPQAELKMTITNEVLLGQFKVGDTFYVDFTPVEAAS